VEKEIGGVSGEEIGGVSGERDRWRRVEKE
jgi:hypothetical protein